MPGAGQSERRRRPRGKAGKLSRRFSCGLPSPSRSPRGAGLPRAWRGAPPPRRRGSCARLELVELGRFLAFLVAAFGLAGFLRGGALLGRGGFGGASLGRLALLVRPPALGLGLLAQAGGASAFGLGDPLPPPGCLTPATLRAASRGARARPSERPATALGIESRLIDRPPGRRNRRCAQPGSPRAPDRRSRIPRVGGLPAFLLAVRARSFPRR